MTNENVKVGTMAVAKVGRNEIKVEIIAVEDGCYTVRNKSGKFFLTRRVEPIPIPEQERKRLSLLDAAIEVLRRTPCRDCAEHARTGQRSDRTTTVDSHRLPDAGADTVRSNLP